MNQASNDKDQQLSALRASEERFRLLVETSSDWIWEVDRNGTYTYASPSVRHLLGYAPEEIIGKTPFDLMSPVWRERVQNVFLEAVSQRQPLVALENVNLHKNGSEVVLETSGVPFFDAAGELRGYRGIDRDITIRKKNEAALRQYHDRLEDLVRERTRELEEKNDSLSREMAERSKAEQLILEREEQYRELYEKSPVGYQSLDVDGRFITVNQAWLDTLGYAPEEVLGKWFGDFLVPEAVEHFRRRFEEFKAAGKVHSEFEMVRKDGARRYIAFDGRIGHDQQGGFKQTHCVLRDITEQRRLDAALSAREKEFRTLAENAPDIIVRVDPDMRIIYANPARAAVYGVPCADMVGKTNEDLGLSRTQAQFLESQFREVFVTGRTKSVNFSFVSPDGRSFYFDSRIVPETVEGGVVSVLSITRDITELNKTENELRESERRLSTLLSNLPGMAYRCGNDQDWTMEFVSDGCQTLTGYAAADLVGNHVTSYNLLIHPDDRERIWTAIQNAVRQKAPFQLKYRITAADGSEKWMWGQGRGIFSGDALEALEGFIVDITENHRAAAALEKSEERYRLISENMSDVIWLLDIARQRFTYVSPSVQRLRGFTPEEEVGRSLEDFQTPASYRMIMEEFPKRLAAFRAGDASQRVAVHEVDLSHKDGTIVSTEVVTTLLTGPEGEVTAVLGVTRDISRRKQLEAQLRQVQKMEAVGQLAGGIAHDFNNLLTSIMGFAELLSIALKDTAHAPDIHEITKAARRARQLTSQLLTYSRKQILRPQVLNINVLVTDMDRMLKRTIREDIELVTILDPRLGSIKVDPSYIEQVIMNLVVNARDAMPAGGNLTLETLNVTLDENYTRRHPYTVPGDYVLLAVSDTGVGIDPAIKSRIFEPFFSTKNEQGTGLGLATVYGIIKQSRGSVEVYSEVGRGTTFKIYLPRVDESVSAAKPVDVPSGPLRGDQTILIVEDEVGVRMVIRRILEPCGFTLLEARNGDEAKAVIETFGKPIHLVITDMIMTGKTSGLEIARYVQNNYPAVPVLFMSGYTDNAIVHQGMLDPGGNFIAKPFNHADLVLKVRDLLKII
jgi:PAS domain S-box-containing protein